MLEPKSDPVLTSVLGIPGLTLDALNVISALTSISNTEARSFLPAECQFSNHEPRREKRLSSG